MIAFFQQLHISTAGKIEILLAAAAGLALAVPIAIVIAKVLNKLADTVPNLSLVSGVRTYMNNKNYADIPLAVRRARVQRPRGYYGNHRASGLVLSIKPN